jgi:hypothetical protein
MVHLHLRLYPWRFETAGPPPAGSKHFGISVSITNRREIVGDATEFMRNMIRGFWRMKLERRHLYLDRKGTEGQPARV